MRQTVPRAAVDRWIFGLTLALLIWLPLPWGSHRPWAADLLVMLAASLLALRLLATAFGLISGSAALARQLALPVIWWMAWLAWIGAQWWPLDPAALARWSPTAAELYENAAALLTITPVARVSIAPAATLDAWLLSAGYASLYLLVVLSCFEDRSRMRLVLAALTFSGLAQALYGGLMVLSGLEWGFFAEKRFYQGFATGTFVNRNHLAGYLELTAAAALGLVLADLGGGRAAGWRRMLLDAIALAFSAKMRARLALVVMAIALVLTRSRMGNVAFVASLTICAMGYVLLRQRQYALRAFVVFASVVAVDILIVSNWYGLERVVERIERTDLATEQRATFLADVPPALAAYELTGAGLGSFAVAFAPYRSARMTEYFDHAHNDYIEMFIETGIVGCVLLALFVLGHVVHALHTLIRRRRRMAAGASFAALMGMVAFAIHSAADFNLQIPANAATLLVLMALGSSCKAVGARARRASGSRRGEGLDSGDAPGEGQS